MADSPALMCRGLVHVYRADGTDVAALRGVDLAVPAGQQVALLGPSGSGKSTLFSILAGVLRPSAGSAEIFGVDLARTRPALLRRLRRERLGVMLQGAERNLRVHEDAVGNVRAVLRVTGHRDDALGREVLAAGGVAEHGGPVGRLPPAQQQVVALACAIGTRPSLLLADEPTSRLDDVSRDLVMDAVVQTAARIGAAVLIVTHDPQVAARMQRMVYLHEGRVAEEGDEAGRYAVIAADRSVLLPSGVEVFGWSAGELVTVRFDDRMIAIERVQRSPAREDG